MARPTKLGAPVKVIGRRELAELWGISPYTIDEMLQRGELRKIATGLIDFDHAQAVRASQDPAAREKQLLLKRQASHRSPMSGPAPSRTPEDADHIAKLHSARAIKVVSEAQLSQLRLRQVRGELLDVEETRRQGMHVGRMLVSRLRALPSRCAAQVAPIGSARECEGIVRAEIDSIIAELQEELARL